MLLVSLKFVASHEMQHCGGVIGNSLIPQGEYQAHNSPCSSKVSYPSSLLYKERELLSGSWGVKPLGELGSYIHMCVHMYT